MHHAAKELLSEGDYAFETLTIPVVAARADVHPTTVYRRWRTIPELLADVATSSFSGEVVVPDTGSLPSDLERWVDDIMTDLQDPDVQALIRAAVGAGPEAGSACITDRRAQLAAMLERERSRGGATPDLEQAADLLLGPLYYRAIFTGRPVETGCESMLVALLLSLPPQRAGRVLG
ncbi:TetR/AcrR family transcriptional regulator C-terminal ligand-binding domain-containing protein [Streptomyces sp. NPDC051664]|uniref:TetR/AcrR family transcriptional regulator n=1 Tax=Streptomyces sp. NPDC051664 TaxID=3365668 RepID=UPI0037AC3BF1